MSVVKFGMIGCGVIAGWHAKAAAASPHTTLAAVTDLRPEAASAFAREHGVATVHESAAALLADPALDAVILAMPVKGRTKLAIEALHAGKHVLLEKPAAMNADEVAQIAAAQREGLVVGCCSSRQRFLPSADKATEVIASGVLGPLRVVRGRAVMPAGGPPKSPPPVWRVRKDLNAGGIMSNWGVYDLDYLLGVCGWRLVPRQVLAQVWGVSPQFSHYVAEGSDAETHVAALVQCEGGTVLTLERGEFLPTVKETAWQVIGERGALRMTILPSEHNELWLDEADDEQGVVSKCIWQGAETWDVPHHGPVRDLAEAILEGPPPRTGLAQAMVIQRITDAIYASAESGQAVAMEDVALARWHE
ncbi:MAG: Gfo/Idh/MocA family oxidoreductase [Phycisphaeraceae bacterium]